MNLTADETYWEYVYDHLNQLSSAQHIGDDGESMLVIPGESHEYIYDDIGNRIAVYEGGGDGQYPYLASYTTNLLNQYTARDVPGHVEVVGRTSSGSIDEVKVNTNTAWKLGDIYAKRVTFDNSAAPVVGEISVSEYISSALIRTSWWDAFIPKDPESFTYDADGNLTLDGVWHYTWDAENRLKSMQMRDEVAAVLLTGSNPWARLEFSYDWMGRRIGKVYQTSTSDPATHGGKHGPPILWMIDKDIRYVYDGWMLSMSFNANSLSGCDPDQSFAWGPDLSGGYGGAGGIGGLVAYSDDQHDALNPAPSDPDFLGPMFPIYDGNGNVVKMIRFEDLGSSTFEAREAAAYEYGPFGENRSTTGELGSPSTGGTHQGQRNPFRFSTKYTDAETGLVYYGYRYYSPSMGRWISRDPIQEDGGVNLLAFVGNCSPNFCDPVGLDWLDNLSNFFAGAGDSLTFGLTRQVRKGLNWMCFGGQFIDHSVNPSTKMYVAGEVTEVVVEIVATGGGAALRHVATRTVRRGLEGGAVTAFRRKIGEVRGGFVHHINPIKGHPAIKDRPNQIARYPLPFKWSARGHWNMRHYRNADDHLWAHQRMLYAEAVDRLRESTILIRQAANELFLWMEGSRPCYDDWSIEIRAYVFGEIFAGLVNAGFPPVGSPHFIDVVAQMEDLER